MPVANRQTLSARVHQHLVAKLASGELSLGSHLNATALATQLEVSRTTVRKAIDQLIEEGCVRIDESQHPIVVKSPLGGRTQVDQDFDTANQTENTVRSIYEKVLRRECLPGDTVRAHQLGEELEVSLVTVRQALDWLCRDGLFVRIPRRGWQVAMPTLAEIRDIYHCRLALEPLALQAAVHKISDSKIEELQNECRQLLDNASDLSEYKRLDIDMKFHLALAESAESRILIEAITPLLKKRLTFTWRFQGEHTPQTFAEEHLRILDGLQDRDVAMAVQSMKAHLNRALKAHTKRLKGKRG